MKSVGVRSSGACFPRAVFNDKALMYDNSIKEGNTTEEGQFGFQGWWTFCIMDDTGSLELMVSAIFIFVLHSFRNLI